MCPTVIKSAWWPALDVLFVSSADCAVVIHCDIGGDTCLTSCMTSSLIEPWSLGDCKPKWLAEHAALMSCALGVMSLGNRTCVASDVTIMSG